MLCFIFFNFTLIAISTKSNNTNNISLKNNNYKNETKGLGTSDKKSTKAGNEVNSLIEDDLMSLKHALSPNEFFNSVKSGFDLALCK